MSPFRRYDVFLQLCCCGDMSGIVLGDVGRGIQRMDQLPSPNPIPNETENLV